jgi:hypothetical protein
MKRWVGLFLLMILFSLKSTGQVITQTYIDPCDLKTYTVVIPITTNGVTIVVRNKSKVFNYAQFVNGEVDAWIKSVFAAPCQQV